MLIQRTMTKYFHYLCLHTLTILYYVSRLTSFTYAYNVIIKAIVRKSGLFDKAYYSKNYPEVVEHGFDPLHHFVKHGDSEGRLPIPCFDPTQYRVNLNKPGRDEINSLVHYMFWGRYNNISPSLWFKTDYYLVENRDVKFQGLDPLVHFIHKGGLEGRSPSPLFDSGSYLRAYQDVAKAKVNPLIHYLTIGALEGRSPQPDLENGTTFTPTIQPLPSASDWEKLAAHNSKVSPVIDVIIPVYRGKDETLRCIYNVLFYQQQTPFELFVINDCSPEPELTEELKLLSEKKLFTYLENSENQGFVATANRGMSLNDDHDVILLNSDTEVYNDWLDRLRNSAYSSHEIGTCTPLSNNATICSYPKFITNNPYPLEIPFDVLDLEASRVNKELHPIEAPTGVGFCMYIKRKAIQAVGSFDEAAFGAGYGEENDFCQKLILQNFKNVVSPNIFVRHLGAVSFLESSNDRINNALKCIKKRYPNYLPDVQQFVNDDPLLPARANIDSARLNLQKSKYNVLIISHNRGGGTEKCIHYQVKQLKDEGKSVYFLRPGKNSTLAELSHQKINVLHNLPPIELTDESFKELIRKFEIDEICIHQLTDFIDSFPKILLHAKKTSQAVITIYIHDYFFICPTINLIGTNKIYCGEEGGSLCTNCFSQNNLLINNEIDSIDEWRKKHRKLLNAATRVYVPDDDVAQRIITYFPTINVYVKPHDETSELESPIQNIQLSPKDDLKIVIIGAIGDPKGYGILLSCAQNAQKRKLPLKFILMGYSKDDRQLARAGVKVTGKYCENNAESILKEIDAHIVWLPSVWPETFSYTLSLALHCRYEVAAFNIGAIANRLKQVGMDHMIHPLDWAQKPALINDTFVEYRLKKCS